MGIGFAEGLISLSTFLNSWKVMSLDLLVCVALGVDMVRTLLACVLLFRITHQTGRLRVPNTNGSIWSGIDASRTSQP